MIALGWTAATTALPRDVTYHGVGPIRTLARSRDQSAAARERLSAQIRCFEAGIDLVPIAPSQIRNVRAAEALLAQSDLPDMVMRLQGTGQLTLSLHLPSQPPLGAVSGRDWLAARRANHSSNAALADRISEIFIEHAIKVTPLRHIGDDIRCDMLVRRERVAEMQDYLVRRLQDLPQLCDAKVVITGPWPPFGFAEIQRVSGLVA